MTEPMDPKKETLRASLSARLKKSRGYFWSVFPWPEQFFEREEDLDPIASDLMVSITSIILFALCAAAFGYTYVFFSDPRQHTVDQIVSARTSIDGYTCKPMGPDKWYDLNWTYAECVDKVRPLTAENVDWPEPGTCENMSSGWPPSSYACNCPPGERISFRPFGDLQRRNGVAPKAAEARTAAGAVDYPAAVALGGTCPDPEFSPMDHANMCTGVTMPASSDSDDTHGVGLRCHRWSGGNFDEDWALEFLNNTIAHFTDPDLGVCEFTLRNVPYECVKKVPMDPMTVLALANNNAALVYTVLAVVFGFFLSALTKLRVDPGGNVPPREDEPKVHWVRKLPLPASLFFDEPAELDFIDNDFVIGFSTFAVVSVTAACFAVFMGYYSGAEHDLLDVRFGDQWNVTGYECAPLQVEEEWGTNISYSECLTSIRPVEKDVSVIFKNAEAKYVPFDSSTEGLSGVVWGMFEEPTIIGEKGFCTKSDSFPQWDTGSNPSNYRSDFDWESTEYQIGSGRIYPQSFCDCELAAMHCSGPSCGSTNCEDYTWTDEKKEDAVVVWRELLALIGDRACDFTKNNAPFSCSKTEPLDLQTRVSLAYGNAELIFASVCAVVAVLMRRRKKFCSCGKLTSANVKKSLRSTTVGKYIAIPSNFYRKDVMELIAPPMVTLFGFVLWTAAFVASFVYLYQFYASKTWVETTFISETSKEGATCKPIRPHTYYNLDWNYDTCMAKKERPSLENAKITINSALCETCVSGGGGGGPTAYYVCDNFTSWGFRPWGADGPEFRYMKRDSTTDLETRLETFVAQFNTKWNNDGGCSSACEGCPKVELSSEGSFYGYKSYGAERLYFKRNNGASEAFATTASELTDWGLLEKLGDIYDYLLETDELCSWTLENVPYSCEMTKKASTIEAVSLAFANAELIGIGTGIVIAFLVKSLAKLLKKGDAQDAAQAGLGKTAAAGQMTFSA